MLRLFVVRFRVLLPALAYRTDTIAGDFENTELPTMVQAFLGAGGDAESFPLETQQLLRLR